MKSYASVESKSVYYFFKKEIYIDSIIVFNSFQTKQTKSVFLL